MYKNISIIFCWLFGSFFILLGIDIFIQIHIIPFNLAGIIFIFAGYFFIKNRNRNWGSNRFTNSNPEDGFRKAGEEGEKLVSYTLDWLDKEKYIVFNNLKLQIKGVTQQFDHIVVGTNGIFNIETKAYSGKIIIDVHGNWSREKVGRIEGIENPIFQTQRHYKVLNDILRGKYPILNIVVLSNKSCTIEGLENSPLTILKADILQYFIENYKLEKLISQSEIMLIENIIRNQIC